MRKVRLDNKSDLPRITPGVAFAYDWLFNSLSLAEQKEVRVWLTSACNDFYAQLEDQVFGFKKGAGTQRFSNWVGFITGAFGATALAVENEPGYQSIWYTDAASSMRDFLQYGIGPEGASVESIHYFAYGMANGAFFLDAMARRGDPVFANPHLKNVPLWWTYDLYPWGKDFNDLQDTRDLMVGVEEIYDLLHLVYRNNPVMQWVYANYVGNPNGGPISPTASALWASDPDDAIQVADLKLPLGRYFSYNGLAYLRSGWSKEDVYLEFQSDPVAAVPTHAHADRNSFTLAANQRLWITDGGGWLPQDMFHNLVFIDGKAEGYFPQRGKVTQFTDTGWAAGVSGDAKDAYSWRTQTLELKGGQLVNGLNSLPYNPVLYAGRSAILVRGEHPYVLIVDEIQKDQQSHEYSWRVLSPLGNSFSQTNDTEGLLTPADTGAYIQASLGSQPLQCPFEIKSGGKYNIWLLVGHDYWAPWNWGGVIYIDGAHESRFVAREGDNSQRHWQLLKSNDVSATQISQGEHALSIAPTGAIQLAAILIAPESFNPLLNNAPKSSDYITKRFADFPEPLPRGWVRMEADKNPPQLSIQVLNPASAKLSVQLFDRIRPDNHDNQGPELQVSAEVSAVEPSFHILLYPHREDERNPSVKNTPESSVISWPDGITDTITFKTGEAGRVRIVRQSTREQVFDLSN